MEVVHTKEGGNTMSLQTSHAPYCESFSGRCCDCGSVEVVESALSTLKELARKSRCPVDGSPVIYEEETNELVCAIGHKLIVDDE